MEVLKLAAVFVSGVAVAALAMRATRRPPMERRRRPTLKPKGSRAVEIIKSLGLIPHPEGGFFLETYRAGARPMISRGQTDADGELISKPAREGSMRNTMTSIYFMLTAESPRQWWANNMSDHVHYWQGGGELIYRVIEPDGSLSTHTLGPACPQLIVRGGSFKCAQLAEAQEYCLLGEAVAPGFDFRDFKFVTADELKALVPNHFGELCEFIKKVPENSFDNYYERENVAETEKFVSCVPSRQESAATSAASIKRGSVGSLGSAVPHPSPVESMG